MENNYFQDKEFYCNCGVCERKTISIDLLEKLNKARKIAKIPFIINSGVRCEEYNKKVGGVANSSHILGYACDIRFKNSSEMFKILNAVFLSGFKRIGVYKNFIHVDIDESKPQFVMWYK